MVLANHHCYFAEASDSAGRRLGELKLKPDFGLAAEWAHLQAVRSDAIAATAHYGPGTIEPVIDEVLGPPFICGIRIRFDAQDPSYQGAIIHWRFFQPSVEASASRLVRNGALRAGEIFRHRVYTLPQTENDPVPTAGADVESEATLPLKLKRAALGRRLHGAGRLCPTAWNNLDFPLFVKPDVLAEATALAQSAGEWEIGGILVGYLHRDTDSPEVYAEITAQIPASLADAGHTHLGFTPQAWAAVSDALALRDLQEIILGWWHYHPFFCRHCDLARRHHCLLSRPFFSRDDQELHRVVFDTAFSVALLLSDIGEASLCCDWFGWRCGAVETRGCYLLNEYHSNPDDHPTESHSTATHTANAREHPHEQ